jgi:hypothetical protein
MEDVKNLQVSVRALNKEGGRVADGVLKIKSFGQSEAERFATTIWEAEELCDDNLTIFVDKATAIVAGKRTDLIRSKSLSARDFKPFKIRIGK